MKFIAFKDKNNQTLVRPQMEYACAVWNPFPMFKAKTKNQNLICYPTEMIIKYNRFTLNERPKPVINTITTCIIKYRYHN